MNANLEPMKIHQSGWLDSAKHLASPNFEKRPNDVIDLIVLHNISLPPFEYGTGAIDALFTNQIETAKHPFFQVIKDLRVSSHLLIDRQGDITQYVSFLDMAYHAGVSSFKNQTQCNAFSIGIELEGCDFEPFTEAQYQTLLHVLPCLCKYYPIKAITGHEHIAPDRKTDPGHFFDWNILQNANLPIDFNK